MATIHIDGKPYQIEDGRSLLDACLALGFNLPYFCWHPALGSVGACRQCAVKQFRDERDTKGEIVMACMTPASDGARISLNDPEAVELRAAVIEWLMVNHPHDCPVCDEGGECHLQDMTVMTGHACREYRFKKRTHRNQWLGPFINHEMNRCIQCYRCVRYYRDYAGGRDFNVFACHDHVYFGRHRDGALENEFSGNLVEICPTGVFTDRTFKKHYTRKWDLQTAPSVCVHCSLGCNTIPGERYGELRRIRNRYNHAVNGYFLCDRGRYGYEFVNSDRRVRRPLLRRAGGGTDLNPGGSTGLSRGPSGGGSSTSGSTRTMSENARTSFPRLAMTQGVTTSHVSPPRPFVLIPATRPHLESWSLESWFPRSRVGTPIGTLLRPALRFLSGPHEIRLTGRRSLPERVPTRERGNEVATQERGNEGKDGDTTSLGQAHRAGAGTDSGGDAAQETVSAEEALGVAAALMADGRKVIGIGSPRASLESNFALRALVGSDHFFAGISDGDFDLLDLVLDVLLHGPVRIPSLHETMDADAVFVLGEDVTNTAPMLALNLRQLVRRNAARIAERAKIPHWHDAAVREVGLHAAAKLYVATPHGTRLDDVALLAYRAAPEDLARFGSAVASLVGLALPEATDLPDEERPGRLPEDSSEPSSRRKPEFGDTHDCWIPACAGMTESDGETVVGQAAGAEEIARVLLEAERPLIISGTGCGSRAVIQAAADVCRALCANGRPAELLLALPECNSLGLALLGAAGGIGAAAAAAVAPTPAPAPSAAPPSVPADASAPALLGAGAAAPTATPTATAVPQGNGGVDTVIVLENDLYRRAEREIVEAFLDSAKHVIAVDHLAHDTTRRADVVLPAATFAEGSGTLVNNEGRAQRFYSVFSPEAPVRESWRWLRDLMIASGRSDADGWHNLDDVVKAISATVPALSRLTEVAPDSTYRAEGGKVPRQSRRYSGRTAMRAHISVHEAKPPEDADTPLAFSMEGDERRPPPSLIPRFWAPGWNSVQSVNKFQSEIGGPLRGGDPGLRLIEPRPERAAIGIDTRKTSFPEDGDWQLVPLHHIFGSEELSVLAPAVAERCPKPYLALHPADAAALGVEEGDRATATVGRTVLELPVRVLDTLPRKVAGLPVGLPGLPVVELPGHGTIRKGESNE